MDFGALFSLTSRVALVTGGSRGIGRWIAEGLIAQGAKVYITSRSAEQCEATATELGPNCVALPQDVSSADGCRALAATLGTREQRLDILVNNAGMAWGEAFESFPESGFDKVLSLNLKTPFFLTQALHSLLREGAGAGHPAKVINIASIDGIRLNPWETYSYQASKAGLIQLTRRMAARLVIDGIHVSAIAPGAFASRMNKAARDQPADLARIIPAGRVGNPEDIAAAAVYLASKAGDYVIGSTLAVDGGLAFAELGAGLD